MSESANIPTFKLVLVGDGGTGKVKIDNSRDCLYLVLIVLTFGEILDYFC